MRGIGSFYTARDPEGNEFTLRCKKKFRHLGNKSGEDQNDLPRIFDYRKPG